MHKLFDGVRKGDFAQELAEAILKNPSVAVPQYLKDAIKEATLSDG